VAPRDPDCLDYVWRCIPNKEGLYHGAFSGRVDRLRVILRPCLRCTRGRIGPQEVEQQQGSYTVYVTTDSIHWPRSTDGSCSNDVGSREIV
jgi:hypothetical protein